MEQHQHPNLPFGNHVMGRREFIKWAFALGLSASAIESLFSQQEIALAHSMDFTSGLVGYWKFDDGSGTTAVDSSGNGNNGTLNGGPTWTTGRINDALSFNGSSSEVDINKNVLNTAGDYTVAAWVQLNNASNWASAVSQDGTNVSGFFLQYTNPNMPNGGRFAFSLINADSTQGTTTRAISPFNPSTGIWYHLAGVHDSTNNQIKLYVNGTLVDTQSVGAAWNASGETVVGRARFNGPVDFWPGLIDDVRVYNRILSSQDVADLYNSAPAQSSPNFTPIRPPATPLVVRSPYISTWLASSLLPGTWPTFWNGNIKAITGIARIDGNAYIFMGAPGNIGPTQMMKQTNLTVTPTKSIFTLQGGGVTLVVTFLSPVEANDIQKLSVPLSYIFARAQSNDGKSHAVSLYFDISGEWAHGDSNALINWGSTQVPHANGNGNITTFTVTPNSPQVLAEVNDYPSWGTVVWATHNQLNLSIQSGQDTVVRSQFVSQGQLNNSMDPDMPRAINNRWPVFAFDFNLGSITTPPPDQQVTLVLGHVREPAVSYLGTAVPPLWQSYWPTWQQMLVATYDGAQGALASSSSLDAMIMADADKAGGTNYAALCALALRQAFGGVELVGTSKQPWYFLKEISSDGNVSTIDVVYPSFPVFYYLNPYLLSLLLEPILHYAESGLWPRTFCVHDLGSHYPNASGHNDGGGENMPVEETANMLIMAASYAQQAGSAATGFINAHYKIFKQWADYLNAPNGGNPSRPNALDPLLQNQTDDFTGFIAHSTNLALKGIIAIGAMGVIAGIAGNQSDQKFYSSTAVNLISQWAQLGQDPSQQHLDISYNESDTPPGTGPGTYSLKYNAFPDKLLGLNLVPTSVSQEEAAWYSQFENAFGVPLDTRHTYTKADWELWTAASTDVTSLRQYFINALYNFANTSASRVPFTDWYDTISDQQVGFQARPVMGGLFSILARLKSNH